MDGGTITNPSDSKQYNWHSSDGLLMVLHDIRFELENPKCVLIFESYTSRMNTISLPLFYIDGLHNKGNIVCLLRPS
jgi:hypothetical protein